MAFLTSGFSSAFCKARLEVSWRVIRTPSHHGEVIGREDFGSMIWDLEFNQLVKISDWEEGVKNSLIKTIEKYEKRLRNVDVNVTLLEIEEENIDKVSHVRRKAQITVTGTMDRTNEKFSFNTSLYISPLSQ